MRQIIRISSLDEEELQIFRNCNEAQLLHFFEPAPGLFIAESPMVVERALNAGYTPYSMLIDEKLLKENPPAGHSGLNGQSGPDGHSGSDMAQETDRSQVAAILKRCGDIPVRCGNEELLGRLTGYKLTRGMLCAMYRKPLPGIREICENASRIAVLYDVENPTNVGAIFRNAAALGIDAVLLTRSCADPLYRRSLRVSLGTVLMLPWTVIADTGHDSSCRNEFASRETSCRSEKTVPGSLCMSGDTSQVDACGDGNTSRETSFGNGNSCVRLLHDLGFTTVAMALRDNSLTPDDPGLKKPEKAAVILGNESFGLPDEVIGECDKTVMIPMQNGVDSLNVAAASAIAFWEFMKR